MNIIEIDQLFVDDRLGYLTEGTSMIVHPPWYKEYKELDQLLERLHHEKNQKTEAFIPQSWNKAALIEVPYPSTPLLEAEEEKAKQIRIEQAARAKREMVVSILNKYPTWCLWVAKKAFVSNEETYTGEPCPMNAKYLRLSMTSEELVEAVFDAIGD